MYKNKSYWLQRILVCISSAILAAPLGSAHFVFVTPEPGNASARVILSENLVPDLDAKMIVGTTLYLRAAGGATLPLTLSRGEKAYLGAPLPGTGNRVVHGVTTFGVMQRGEGKPHLLVYHPKAVLGDPFDKAVGETPVEIVAAGKPGAVTFRVLARGKPLPESEITVIQPDGSERKLKTNTKGETPAMEAPGRYGAWARQWEQTPGEHNGKKYEEVRHYATLVVDVPAPVQAFATLPEAASSFGATTGGDWLYVYGGHVVPTHSYSRESVSGKFHRMKLDSPGKWETLPEGRPLQGMNLAAHSGKIYRVGGMEPRNKKGQPADNHSIVEVARFDPVSGKWEEMPPLPESRSSHDVAVVGDKLFVVGGWALEGPKQHWRDTVLLLDLAAAKPRWTSVPQPFQRRALMTAVLEGKVYVIGGMNAQQKVVRDVSIFDPAANQWSEGPALPEGTNAGFAPAASVHRGHLYVSIADGSLLRLDRSANAWVKVGETVPRVAHRLASYDDKLLAIGGAAKGKNFDLIEAVAVE